MKSGRAGSPDAQQGQAVVELLHQTLNLRLCLQLACTALARRQVCIRMRPASLTAAAPPSSCQVTHSVSPIQTRDSTRMTLPTLTSLAVRLESLNMAALYPPACRSR
jgi:hypothetical protein